MYKLIIAVLISAFLINAAMNVRADFANKVHARLTMLDNIAK
jgi:hypothetical protein